MKDIIKSAVLAC